MYVYDISIRSWFRQGMGISTSAHTQVPLYEELNSEDVSQGLNHFHKKGFFMFSCRNLGTKWIRWVKWLIYDISYKQKGVALLSESKSVISGAHFCLVAGWCWMCNHLMRTPWWLKIQERMNVVIEEYMTRAMILCYNNYMLDSLPGWPNPWS